MTKFEEEAIKEAEKSEVIANCYDDEFTAYDIGLNIKLERGTYNFPWLEFAKNWHSDGEFQELLSKYSGLNHNYEKEVIRSSKLESQIIDLKSQLQQQALPVVPECVAEFIEFAKTEHLNLFNRFDVVMTDEKVSAWLSDSKAYDSGERRDEILARAWLDGYTVEKPQLFYLKNKLTGLWLMRDEVDKVYPYDHTFDIRNRDKFTQAEIDSMQTGSYEQIEVTE